MPIPFDFDWKAPDYIKVFDWRIERLNRIRAAPQCLPALKLFYRENPAQFVIDWGITVEPRNVELGLPSAIPFLLFPRQEEWVAWIIDNWRHQRPGLTVKTRQMGFSWLTCALSCTLCLFHDGMSIGMGSRKQEYVDVLGDPKSLIEKARIFMANLPREFRGGWDAREHAPHMRMMFPDSQSIIVGEAGENIGRGNSTSLFWVDEAAFLEHPMKVDAALSQTTNCRQDVSTPNGMGNPFAQKVHGGKIPVFQFTWRDDKRKTQDWYDKQVAELDPVIVAQELDCNFAASTEGVVIPSAWVQSAIGARQKLGLDITGRKYAGLDVADEGADKNAFAGRHGIELQVLKSWSGKGGDIYQSVVKAFALCDEHGYESFFYDSDGLGAGVRGDARVINEERASAALPGIRDDPFRGSGAVFDPEGEMVAKRLNKDYFANAKAMSAWSLRLRFEATNRAVAEGMAYDADKLISIDPDLEELGQLVMELSQPRFEINQVGKIVIEKTPPGTRSPNLFDAVMIAYNPGGSDIDVWLRLGA
jgi:phage terminase large subunit